MLATSSTIRYGTVSYTHLDVYKRQLVDGTVNFKVGKEDRRYVSVIPATEA